MDVAKLYDDEIEKIRDPACWQFVEGIASVINLHLAPDLLRTELHQRVDRFIDQMNNPCD